MNARPVRLQLLRAKGFDLQAWSREYNDLPAKSVARPHLLGNPFPVDVYGAKGAVDRHKRWLCDPMSPLEMSQSSRADIWAARNVSLTTLRGWTLDDLPKWQGFNFACWCQIFAPCHADVLLELANRS